MGAEFLRRTKPTIKKAVDKHRAELACADLFTQEPKSVARTALVYLINDNALCDRDTVIVELTEDKFVVSKDGRYIGEFRNPTEKLTKAIKSSCGIAKGEVIRVNKLSKTAEVSVS